MWILDQGKFTFYELCSLDIQLMPKWDFRVMRHPETKDLCNLTLRIFIHLEIVKQFES